MGGFSFTLRLVLHSVLFSAFLAFLGVLNSLIFNSLQKPLLHWYYFFTKKR